MLETINKRLWTLFWRECLLFCSSCLFLFYDAYFDWYIAQHTEYEFHKVMALGQYLIGIFVSCAFGIGLLILVRSVWHFLVGIVLVMVQLWMSLLFCSSGAYEIEFAGFVGLVFYMILTCIHIWIAWGWMKTLTARRNLIIAKS